LLGLPGETVEIRDGDLYIDGLLCRKTLDEFKAMRIPVFDNNHQPRPMTWAARWEQAPYRPDSQPLQGTSLHLDAAAGAWHLVAYLHLCLDSGKCLPILRPVVLAARDARAVVSNVRLWRDVHYTQAGANGVRGAVVRLGAGQYFVLGDDSPRSEDSRFWPDGGAVPAPSLVGAPLLW